MGSGKSSVGRVLSSLTGFALVDTDTLVAQEAGKSIPAIFKQHGEPHFRALETKVLQSLVGRIGPVYTVPEARGRGIGAAITAVVTRDLLAEGATVMLFADADNATSNGVYERLGFRAVDELIETDLL